MTEVERAWLDKMLAYVVPDLLPGQLNYLLTSLLVTQYEDNKCYNRFNDLIGALECAKLELYRRVIGPYEDKKKELNGDVYE